MTNYIPIIGLSILAIGALYKVITKKDVTESKKETKSSYKQTSGRFINDHMADVMNIKKKK